MRWSRRCGPSLQWTLKHPLPLLLLLLLASSAAAQLDKALDLQRQGRAQEALVLIEKVLPALRDAKDRARLAQVLSAAGEACLSTGKYQATLGYTKEALTLHEALGDSAAQARDWNALGLADMYLANYGPSLEEYQRALTIDRASHDAEGEIARLNNIGNIYYFQGRYLDALHSFQSALDKVNQAVKENWFARRRQITIANLATVYQRLGAEAKALELYSQLGTEAGAARPSESAQMLLNEGVLYRRLGDPVKALDMYRSAQALFAKDQHRDGEIGALRNIGIARGLDLNDLPGALDAFQSALQLAQQAGNNRAQVQAQLYSGEVLRRMGRFEASEKSLENAIAGAQKAGLVEEQWKALYATGLMAAARNDNARAEQCFAEAIRLVESVRSGLQLASLKTDFLADKRDVYDALIELRLKTGHTHPADFFHLIEHSRARTLQDRIATGTGQPRSLATVQSKLDAVTLLIEYWVGANAAAALWIRADGAGVVQMQFGGEQAGAVTAFAEGLARGAESWRSASAAIGQLLLSGLPLDQRVQHLIVIPDGILQTVPYEALQLPSGNDLLIERYDVSYLPTADLLTPARTQHSWRLPWQRELAAIGDPVTSSTNARRDALNIGEWQRLPHAAEEIRAISSIVHGRADQHLGADARKTYIRSTPLLHLSTHAAADMQDPERSRILFASNDGSGGFDYLFLREIYGMNLKGVDLVTVSACDTERGKLVRGEGAQGLSRAFLAAGAAASVTSLWRVVDASATEFMKAFYFELSRGQSKAEALRGAKLTFLRSGSKLAHPRFWATFVLSGEGRSPIPPVVPWSWIFGIGAVPVFAIAFLAWRRNA